MWSQENGRMKLDLSKVNLNEFKIVTENNLHLVFPKKNKWDWEDGEKLLRSIVVDDKGFVVSSSWKKFCNYGESKTDTDILNNALANGGEVLFSHKEELLCLVLKRDGLSVFDFEVFSLLAKLQHLA